MIIKLLLAALASSSCSAWAAPAGQAVVLSTEAAHAANQRLGARCAKSMNLDELLAGPQRSDLATSPFDEVREMTEYSVCRELQAAPGACAALEGTKASVPHCTTLAAEARFAFATLRGGDALAACRAVMALDSQRGPAVDRSCAILIKAVRDGDVAGSCPALEREKIITPENTCADIQAMWSGSSQDCARYKDVGTRRECVSRAAMVAGLREPSKCAASPACQALASKAPGACDALRAQVARNLCARVAKDLAAAAALDPKQRVQVEAQAKEKGAKATAARVAAAAAAVAAEKAKVDAAAAKSKAETLAAQEKIAKMAAADAARRGEANAAVLAKAEAEAKKQEKAKADALKKPIPQFSKGAPMVTLPQDAADALKAIEQGKTPPKPKAKPKKQEKAPADQ